MDLLKESEIYKKGQENAYDMLFNFLNRTYSGKTLAERRRVEYAVSELNERLPDKEEEIQRILDKRHHWEMIHNTGHEDLEEAAKHLSI